MRQKGFTLMELLVVLAILGIMTAVIILGTGGFFGVANNETAINETIASDDMTFAQLFVLPVGSLNLTDLTFMVEYCLQRETSDPTLEQSMFWLARAMVYQNQIIINELAGGN